MSFDTYLHRETEDYMDDSGTEQVEEFFKDCQELTDGIYLTEDGEIIKDREEFQMEDSSPIEFYDEVDDSDDLYDIVISLADDVKRLTKEIKEAKDGFSK